MSAEAVSQLELHIAECEDCSEFIEEKRRTLKEMARERKAVAYVEDPEPTAAPMTPEASSAQALVQILKEKAGPKNKVVVLGTEREPARSKPIQWKAFIYSGALGLMLLVMSHLTANPTALFGERVAAAETPSKVEPKPVQPSDTRDPFVESNPESGTAASTAASRVEVVKPATATTAIKADDPKLSPKPVSDSSTPPNLNSTVQVTSRPIVRRRAGQRRKATQRPAKSGNSIRVYDENGRPLSGA